MSFTPSKLALLEKDLKRQHLADQRKKRRIFLRDTRQLLIRASILLERSGPVSCREREVLEILVLELETIEKLGLPKPQIDEDLRNFTGKQLLDLIRRCAIIISDWLASSTTSTGGNERG